MVSETSLRLLPLDSGTHGESIVLGRPVLLEQGVVLTVADASGNAMLERRAEDGKEPVEVTVAGVPVFEVAHYRCGQEIVAGRRRFVLLSPFAVHLRTDDKLARVRSLVESLGASADIFPMISTTNQAIQAIQAIRTKQAQTGDHTDRVRLTDSATEPRGSVTKKKRSRYALLIVCALIGILVLSISVVRDASFSNQAAPRNAGDQTHDGEDPAALNGVSADPVADTPVQRDAAKGMVPAPIVVPHAPQAATAPVAGGFDSAAEGADSGLGRSNPPARISSAKLSKRSIPARADATRKASGEAGFIPPEQEKELRTKLESYQLESGFDPEGAMRKIRDLRNDAPAGTAIRAEIERILQGAR